MLTAEQRAYLESNRVARFATVDGSGRPHALPICFAVIDELIYTPLDRKPKRVPVEQLRRVRDLAANPAVCLVVDTYAKDWTRLRWLQIRGDGAVVPPGPEQQRAVRALQARYAQYATMAMDDLPVIRITPRQAVEWSWSGRTAYAVDKTPHL